MRALLAFLLVLASTGFSNAAEIKFVKNMTWKQILQMARQQNKMIFFDAYASWCGPCKYMESSVYTTSKVAAYYNANFINVKQDMEIGEGVKLSEVFGISAYPTLLFFNPSGKMVHKYVGAMESDDFVQLGKDAKNPETQYYTLKEKVKNNTISDAGFEKWASLAKDVYEHDLDKYIRAFFTRKKDILLNEHTARVAIKYADSLTDTEMFYLVNNQAKISQLLNTDSRTSWRMLYDKLFSLATKNYNESGDKEAFSKLFGKYMAGNVSLAMSDLDIRIALYVDENTLKAAKLLMKYLADGALDLQETGEIFLEHADKFNADDAGTIIQKLDQYQLTAADKGKEGYRDFMYAICYITMEEVEDGKPYAKKAMEAVLPDEYKMMLRLLYAL